MDNTVQTLKFVSSKVWTITGNLFMLNSTIKMIPAKYLDDLIKLRSEKEGKDDNTLWSVLMDFLETKRKMFEKFSPWELDDKSKPAGDTTKKCDICQSPKHLRKDCPKKAGGGKQSNTLNVGNKAKFDEKQKEYGPCPICKKGHTFKGKNGMDLASCRLYDCSKFMSMTVEERAVQIEIAKGCAACTSWTHTRDVCQSTTRPCGVKEGTTTCALNHNRLFHGTRVRYVNVVTRLMQPDQRIIHDDTGWPKFNNDLTLLHVVKLVWPNKVATTLLLDDGATCSIITHKLAGFLGIKGVEIRQLIEVAGKDYEPMDTYIYKIALKDRDGRTHKITFIGLDKITSNPKWVNVQAAYELFPHIPRGGAGKT